MHINHPATTPAHILDRRNHGQGQRSPLARPCYNHHYAFIVSDDDHVGTAGSTAFFPQGEAGYQQVQPCLRVIAR